MPSEKSRKALLDLAIKRQVILERLKSGQVGDFSKIFPELAGYLASAINRLPNDLREENRRFVTRWLRAIQKQVFKSYSEQVKLFSKELEKTAGVFATMEAEDIVSSVAGSLSLKTPTVKQAWEFALETPMSHSGDLLQGFLDDFAGAETKRFTNAIRQGFIQGKTNQQILRFVVGTKSRKFRDGVLQTSRRNAEAIIQTSVQHAASVARQKTWSENTDVIDSYEWVSTLDSKTTTQCKSLDGRQWPVGRGPVPPIHIRCRSTTIAVLKPKYDFLKGGRTRSAEFGPVSAKKDYYSWLKDQSPDFQIQALGPERAKLFQGGGLSIERFKNLQLDKKFDPLSLDEMRVIEPGAFKKAGV